MKIETLHDLFVLKLKHAYDIEHELLKVLPKLSKKSKDLELSKMFDAHLKETQEHIKRLDKAFDIIDVKPAKKKTEAIRALRMDTEAVLKDKIADGPMNAFILASAASSEHYEMALYETLASWARTLKHDQVADLFEKTLEEEVATAEKLHAHGESKLNEEAVTTQDE